MYAFLIIITSFIAVILIIMVLLQSSKGGGLSGTFGGAAGGMGTMFGTRRTADFLSKATWWLGGSMAVLSIVINLFFLPGRSTVDQRESIIQQTNQQNLPQNPTLPQQNQTLPPETQNPDGGGE